MACFHRELLEEAAVEADSLNKIGILMFEFVGDPQLLEVHVYSTEKYTGTPTETEGTVKPYILAAI